MDITIKGVTKEDTAYDKCITFEREGVEYSVILHWDSYDGYDLQFLDGKSYIADPDWVSEWQEKAEAENNEDLEGILDGLTDEVIEGRE
jgi:hypothetical protein